MPYIQVELFNHFTQLKLLKRMSVLVGKDTRLVVQGFTGKEGSFHAEQMIAYGTNVIGGVTPGKGGSKHLDRPVFNTVADSVTHEGANTSVIFVPPAFAADAIIESTLAGIKVIICITEGIPVKDMIRAKAIVDRLGSVLIGPNCPGVITPGEAKVGIMPGNIFSRGSIGVISRSGTLTYEAVDQLTKVGLGQSTAIGIGGDPVIGTKHKDAVKLLNEDPETEAIMLIGEIGGTDEEDAAAYIKEHVKKPVVAFIAGKTAPPGRRMGHAGAIVSGGKGTAQDKMAALAAAGITVCESPAVMGETMRALL